MNSKTYSFAIKRAISLFLTMVFLFSMIVSNTTVAHAAKMQYSTQENLITKASNPSNGKISFYIKIPANTTVTYTIKHTYGKEPLDYKTGSYKNKNKNEVSKQININVKFYGKYEITAKYVKTNTTYQDTDSIASTLKKTITTSKFTWTDANIKKWQKGQTVKVALTYATTITLDVLIAKGSLSSKVAPVITTALIIKDKASATKVTDTKTINKEPIKGWGYRYKFAPSSSGCRKYLLVYDAKGKLYQEVNLGTIPVFPLIK